MTGTPAPSWLDRIAHDLRDPLAPLQTACYLLRRDDLDTERRQELLAMIERQTRRLGDMIEELGDWTRVNGVQPLLGAREPCAPALLLEYALAGSAVDATVSDSAGDDAMIGGDPQRLTQLLRILLEYAHTRGATPAISLHTEAGRLLLDLRIAGAAPEPAQLAGLFEQPQPFDGGLGLRLLIARAIARGHGGELSAMVVDDALQLRCDLPLLDAVAVS